MSNSNLKTRINKYMRRQHKCPLATALIIELQAYLRAANRGAENNMDTAIIFLNKKKKAELEIKETLKGVLEIANEYQAKYPIAITGAQLELLEKAKATLKEG